MIVQTTGKVLAQKVEIADTFWGRFRGLMLRRRFLRGSALIFKLSRPGKYGVHMIFVRFPIDLLYLNENFVVVDLCRNLKPWRTHSPRVRASYIVELPAGTLFRARVKLGQKIVLAQSINHKKCNKK